MKSLVFILLLSFFSIISCTNNPKTFSTKTPYDLVNPFIGTGGHGHTFPGATLPFGLVQLSPDTRLEGWDGCSGYHYTDSIIFGFSHTHLSGTGISDYGDVLLMPFNSKNIPTYADVETQKLIPSLFKKETEKAAPGYYSVFLEKPKVLVELTTTLRTGIHKYNFKEADNNKILLDLNHRDKVLDFKINVEDNKTISGFRQSEAWATNQHVYFYMEFSQPFIAENPDITSGEKLPELYKILSFQNTVNELVVKVGISAVSVENAKQNLLQEAQSWNFTDYLENAKNIWSSALNKIIVQGTDENKLSVFYSALYHTMIAPNTFSDVNGSYRGIDQNIYKDTTNTTYTVFSLWDTFRAAHPLYTIIEQKRTEEFIKTFLKHYEQGGRLPVWELSSNETDCMIGYHSVSVIADAYAKGLQNFDKKKALEAMIHSANLNHFGLESYKKYGYIRAGDEAESVSKTLEYAYDDWCIAQFAKALADTTNHNEFIKRAQYYKNIFDPETNFMRARLNGGWFMPFDPAEVNFNYTEANAWQYSLFVPQDISGLINLMGGAENFEKHLDNMFTANSETTGRKQADITGLIGQYAHGNEPSHHMAYLYNYIEKPHKTQERVQQIIDEQYWNGADGLSGNEDCGQMSAWYVLSASGFYSVTPGTTFYTIGVPAFDEITYNLENGNSLKIKAKNLSNKNKYIQNVTLNGENYYKSYIEHKTIMQGGIIEFVMGETPSETFGIGENNFPKTSILENLIVETPIITAAKKTFTDSLSVTVNSNCNNCKIMFSTNGSDFKTYTRPIILKESATVLAYAVNSDEKQSKPVSAEFLKIKPGRSIKVLSQYANQYAAEGNNALIDNLRGSNNFRTGFWQGYQGQNVEVIVDLGKIEKITDISTGFLQDIRSWIWFPENVTYLISNDGENFTELKKVNNDFSIKQEGSFTKEFGAKSNTKARYVKMIAKNFGDCPDWHLGAGGKSWIFVDEIIIN